jgi:hypothetical protein
VTDDPAAIRELIAQGDDQGAYRQLAARLGWPRGKALGDGELLRYLVLLGELATRRDAKALAELASEVVRDPDSPDRLYDLGYALIDAGAPAIAAAVLWRCLALVGDSEEVVCELVSALESAMAYPDALAVLEDHPALRARSFLCRYLYAYNAAMAGQLALTRATLPTLEPDAPETTTMRDTIAGIVAREGSIAGAFPLDGRDLRGWHYVLTGGLLVHQSPFGFDAPMHGRYAYLADSLSRIALGFDRLATLIDLARIPCIYAPPGRNHEIVALAASTRLGIPLAPWPAIGVPAPGLIAIYDLAEVAPVDIQRLFQRRADQIVFAHASPWTHDSPIAADVTTLLYQSLRPPWEGEEVERTTEAIAAELAGHASLTGDDLAADEPERWAALVERAWPPAPGLRSRMWAGGPVPSNRFT